jgi:hypothetical protein
MVLENVCVAYFTALSIPTIVVAVAGLIISFLQWQSNQWKRKNDLFDRRYKFFKNIESWWISLNTDPDSPDDKVIYEDLIPFAREAKFLFGDDICNHILSLVKMNYSGTPWFASDNFVGPFYKYLSLK